MSDTFIIDHGTIITVFMFIMFIVCVAYTVYVVWLDWQEQRQHEAAHVLDIQHQRGDHVDHVHVSLGTMEVDPYEQRRRADADTLRTIEERNRP